MTEQNMTPQGKADRASYVPKIPLKAILQEQEYIRGSRGWVETAWADDWRTMENWSRCGGETRAIFS